MSGRREHVGLCSRSDAWGRLRARVRETLAPVGPALDLAIFRVTIALFLAWNDSVVVADASAALPAAARVAPTGVGWLVPMLVITPESVRLVRGVMWLACALAGVGLFSRASMAVAVIAGSYVMLVPQLGGAVFHDHHLLWLAAIVAASPCGDALSIDAWLARRRGAPRPTRGRAHGAAIRAAWLVLGCVFFFPGVHKLRTSGLDWILSDNLRNQMWWKWAEDPATQPSFRIDRYPTLLHLGAGAAVAFELAFPFLIFGRRTRALGVIAALLFHAATEHFMGIRFTVLWVTYGVFVPWEQLLAWVSARPETSTPPARLPLPPERERVGERDCEDQESPTLPRSSSAPPSRDARTLRTLALVVFPLLTGIATAGALALVDAYPFACYPTFAWIVPDHMPALEVATLEPDGTRTVLPRALWRDEHEPREWATEWSVIGCYDDFEPARLEAYVRARLATRPAFRRAAAGRALALGRVEITIDPDRRGEVMARTPLATLDP